MDRARLASGGIDRESIENALAGCIVGCRVDYHDVLGSTMNEARKLADGGAPEGTVVVAGRQTKGRGRFDRRWVSSPGKDLFFSVLLRPASAQLRFVNMAATLAVLGAITQTTGLEPSIKWPNDVMVAGRKVSGILIEAAVEAGATRHAVVGIGLNVNLDTSKEPEIATTATSLYMAMGRVMDRATVLVAVLERLDVLYAEVRRGRSLKQEWSSQLDTLGRHVQVRWGDRLVEGRAQGVDEDGNLVLEQPDGSTVAVVAGEVTLQV